jgi:hypothetical protein
MTRIEGGARLVRRVLAVVPPAMVMVMVMAGCSVAFTPTAGSDATVVETVAVPITTVLPETTAAVVTTVSVAPTTVSPTTVPPTTVPPSTVPTAPATTTAPAPVDGVLAADLLGYITVQNEHDGGYDRDLFGYPADPDGDSCDTRAEVLMSESQSLPQVSQPGCTVVEGDWYSLYDGTMYTTAGELEIDHVVALKEAWDSGAWNWDRATLVAYGNDLSDGRTLRAVSVATNRSKGDKDPSNWIPDNGVCEFLVDWVAVKVRWGMTMDQSEFGRIKNLLNGQCVGSRTPSIVPAAVVARPTALPAPPATNPLPFVPVATTPPAAPPADVYYANCDAARAAGAAPLFIGQPGYRTKLDRDGDGVACE